MIGLEFIIKTYNKSSSEVAKKIGVSRQSMNDWIKGRSKIPRKRLEQLSKMFDIPEEYFQKVLKKSEELQIQKRYIESNHSNYEEYEEVFIDDEGNTYSRTAYQNPQEAVLRFLDEDIEETRLIEDIRELIQKENDYEGYNFDVLKKVSYILSDENKTNKRIIKDLLYFLLYQKDGWGGFITQEKEVKEKLEELQKLYKK